MALSGSLPHNSGSVAAMSLSGNRLSGTIRKHPHVNKLGCDVSSYDLALFVIVHAATLITLVDTMAEGRLRRTFDPTGRRHFHRHAVPHCLHR